MHELRLYPAIDVRNGSCVRLEHGDPDRETRYDDDPVKRAQAFVRAGARALHVVDLDAAFGAGENLFALKAICAAVDVPVQAGGGIRSVEDVRIRLDAGAEAVVLGTLLVEDAPTAQLIVAEFGERIVAGIDARGDRVATRGWQHDAATSRDALVQHVASWGVQRIVYTEIARDGVGAGFDVAELAHVAGLADVRVTASGGAKTLADLIELRDFTPSNVDAVIVGRALYEGTIDLAEALAALAQT
jgi:phosphoribosylformimino-5-aminoimidazole carboxamide ribotide isomerase